MLLPLVTAVLLPEFDITAGGLTLHKVPTHCTTFTERFALKCHWPIYRSTEKAGLNILVVKSLQCVLHKFKNLLYHYLWNNFS